MESGVWGKAFFPQLSRVTQKQEDKGTYIYIYIYNRKIYIYIYIYMVAYLYFRISVRVSVRYFGNSVYIPDLPCRLRYLGKGGRRSPGARASVCGFRHCRRLGCKVYPYSPGSLPCLYQEIRQETIIRNPVFDKVFSARGKVNTTSWHTDVDIAVQN